jgi:hypothetical protein
MPGRRWLPGTSTPLDMPLGRGEKRVQKFRARAWSWPAGPTLVWRAVWQGRKEEATYTAALGSERQIMVDWYSVGVAHLCYTRARVFS